MVVFGVPLGCDAALTTRCVGGSCAELAPNTASVSATTGPGGSGGSGGANSECFADCDVSAPGDPTGELPCAIDTVLATHCQHCHSAPPTNGAPFPLVAYADVQALAASTVLGTTATRFSLIHNAVAIDYMPLDMPPLAPLADRKALLEWTCACSPPRAPGEVCDGQ